jgi:hypothetical protein
MLKYEQKNVDSKFVSKIAEDFASLLIDIKSNKRDICIITDVNPYGIIEDMAFFDDCSNQLEIVLINRTMLLVRAYSDIKDNKIQNWCIFSDKPFELSIYLNKFIDFKIIESVNL